MLTINVHFPGRQMKDIQDSLRNFNTWKEAFAFIKSKGFKDHTMVITNLAMSTRDPHMTLKVMKDNGFWIIDLYEN